MLGRMASKAEVVISVSAVEDAIRLVEEAESQDHSIMIYLIGEESLDSNGRYLSVTGASSDGAGAVGVCVLSTEGGTEPDESQIHLSSSLFPEGVLMVVDPYAGEFSLSMVDERGIRRASALLSG